MAFVTRFNTLRLCNKTHLTIPSTFQLRHNLLHQNKNRNFSTNKIETNDYIECENFGQTKKGEDVLLYRLRNNNGMEIEIITYGGSIRSLQVPNKNNESTNVITGLQNLLQYEEKNDFFGCIAGRVANRICGGKFFLNNREYELPLNNGPNSLHGGFNGFDKQVWNSRVIEFTDSKYCAGINLHYLSPDMEEGYPGICDVNVRYLLHKNDNIWEIQYTGNTDSETIINLTNHAYYNLNGNFIENAVIDGSHQIQINSKYITPITSNLIPNGSFLKVDNTAFDFRELRDIGSRIKDDNEQLVYGLGYDHNYVINRGDDSNNGICYDAEKKTMADAAILVGNNSGIKMVVATDQPGIQFYSGNFLTGDYKGLNGNNYPYRSALCLETQHFPDSINQPNFPSILLKKGAPFKSVTTHTFSTV